MVTDSGYCVLKYSFPVISETEQASLKMLNKSINIENEQYYGSSLNKERFQNDSYTRELKMEHVLTQSHVDGDATKQAKVDSVLCKLPVINGEQARTLSSEWQGEAHDKKASIGTIKLDLNFALVDVEDEEGEVCKDQVVWYLTGKIPLVGGAEKTLKSPVAKVKSHKSKMAKLKGTNINP